MGIAAKIEDGNLARRAGDATIVAILRQLGLASDPLAGPLVDYAAPPIVDPRGGRSGEVRCVFRLA
jgi:L-asparaginase II